MLDGKDVVVVIDGEIENDFDAEGSEDGNKDGVKLRLLHATGWHICSLDGASCVGVVNELIDGAI